MSRNPVNEAGLRKPPKGFLNAGATERNAAIRGNDMPTLRELDKRIPTYVQLMTDGSDGNSYRRFFVESTVQPGYYYCYLHSDERHTGSLPEEGDNLLVYPISKMWVESSEAMYKTDQPIMFVAGDVTYSQPDSSQVARMKFASAAQRPTPRSVSFADQTMHLY